MEGEEEKSGSGNGESRNESNGGRCKGKVWKGMEGKVRWEKNIGSKLEGEKKKGDWGNKEW